MRSRENDRARERDEKREGGVREWGHKGSERVSERAGERVMSKRERER